MTWMRHFKNIEHLVYMSRPAYFHSNIQVSEKISNCQTGILFTETFSINFSPICDSRSYLYSTYKKLDYKKNNCN